MKQITVLVTETVEYEMTVDVDDDWPDEWTGDQTRDDVLRDLAEELWLDDGDPIKHFTAVTEREIDWRIVKP